MAGMDELKRSTYCFVCGGSIAHQGNRVTCGARCHEQFVQRLEHEFGDVKLVVNMVTGKTHRVPTRYIIEKGLRHQDLARFPEETAGVNGP